jgi:hypothetical protein
VCVCVCVCVCERVCMCIGYDLLPGGACTPILVSIEAYISAYRGLY